MHEKFNTKSFLLCQLSEIMKNTTIYIKTLNLKTPLKDNWITLNRTYPELVFPGFQKDNVQPQVHYRNKPVIVKAVL